MRSQCCHESLCLALSLFQGTKFSFAVFREDLNRGPELYMAIPTDVSIGIDLAYGSYLSALLRHQAYAIDRLVDMCCPVVQEMVCLQQGVASVNRIAT